MPQFSRSLIALAWGITILASAFPDIVCAKLSGVGPAWMVSAKMGVMALFAVAAFVWKPLQPLRIYCLVLFAFFALSGMRPHIDFTLPGLQAAFGNNVLEVRMQAEQTGKLAVAFAMIALLLLLGYKRHQFFLVLGRLLAPIRPVPLLGFPKADPWLVFGLQWGFYIAAALAVLMYVGIQPSGAVLLKAMPILPLILFYAALNAFNEEMTYRAPMLATLETVGGSQHALWMSAYFFGIAHYFGTPGGIMGELPPFSWAGCWAKA